MTLTGEAGVLGDTPVLVSLCSPQISHGLARNCIRASTIISYRLTEINPDKDLVRTLLRAHGSHTPHNDVSVNDGQHVRRWSHKIIL